MKAKIIIQTETDEIVFTTSHPVAFMGLLYKHGRGLLDGPEMYAIETAPMPVTAENKNKKKPKSKQGKDGGMKSKFDDATICEMYRKSKANATGEDIAQEYGLKNTSAVYNLFYTARKKGLFKEIDEELSHEVEQEVENA